MKRLFMLFLTAAVLLSAVGTAQAVDVRVKGEWDFAFLYLDGTTGGGRFRNYRAQPEDDHFNAGQRLRTQIDFVASEQLQGVLMFEIGTLMWGTSEEGNVGPRAGGALDADGVNIKTKRAYLDWMVPGTDLAFRMGIQALNLPMANGYASPVFSADVAGIVANYKITDMLAMTAFWARPFDRGWYDSGGSRHDEMDLFGLMLPIIGEGWTVTPWGMYGRIGSASGFAEYQLSNQFDPDNIRVEGSDRTNAWWAGLSFEVSVFDPLTFGGDVMYGRMSKMNVQAIYNDSDPFDPAADTMVMDDYQTRGWFVTAAMNYKIRWDGTDWGTPGLFGWWSSGDRSRDVVNGKFGRIPVVGWDDGFGITSFGMPGSAGPIGDSAVSLSAVGTWGIGAQLADMTFVEDLSHTLRFAYYRGTNDLGIVRRWGDGLRVAGETLYLTDRDGAYEVNFDHRYQIYENLAAYLELGYIYLDMKNVSNRDDENNAYKAQVIFKYAF